MPYEIDIRPARRSTSSQLPVRLALVDYRMIGKHENVGQAGTLITASKILKLGYSAPAISVFQRHADTIYNNLPELKATPVTLSAFGELGVADGHHRLAAIALLDELNLLKSPDIPVQLLPVRDTDIVKLLTVQTGDKILSSSHESISIADIEKCFADPNRSIPGGLKTRFEVKFQNGSFDWVRNGQPDVSISRPDFLNEKYPLDELARIISESGIDSDNRPAHYRSLQVLAELIKLIKDTKS